MILLLLNREKFIFIQVFCVLTTNLERLAKERKKKEKKNNQQRQNEC